jgi:hypothetical protein
LKEIKGHVRVAGRRGRKVSIYWMAVRKYYAGNWKRRL